MPLTHLAVGVAIMAIWGSQVVPMKFALGIFSPFILTALRCLLLPACLLPFAPRPEGSRAWIGIALVAVFTTTLHFGFIFAGLTRIGGALGGIVYQLNTPFALVLAAIFLRDRPRPLAWAGIALAFLGVVILAGEPAGSVDVLGVAFVALASLSFAAGNVAIRAFGPFHPGMLNGWASLIALPGVLALSALLETGQVAAVTQASALQWGSAVWVHVMGGMIGTSAWIWLIARHPISKVGPLILLVPPFAVLAGVLVLGETLTVIEVAGGVLSFCGVALTQVAGRKSHGDPV